MAAVHGDEVAKPYRAVEQDGEAGNVVGGKFLQAESDADDQRAAKHRKQRQIEADRLQRDQ